MSGILTESDVEELLLGPFRDLRYTRVTDARVGSDGTALAREAYSGVAHVLSPGRYVGADAAEDDDTPFLERFAALQETLEEQFAEWEELVATIHWRLAGILLDD